MKIGQKILDYLMLGVFGMLFCILWLAKTVDWMIKFWPFFCLLMIPLLLLSLLCSIFAYIGMVIYFILCGMRSVYELKK